MSIIATAQDIEMSTLLSQIDTYKYNPSAIQRTILNHLSNITSGTVNIVDPSNPFIFLLEASAVNTAAAMIDNEANTRKQYPILAQTLDDLYPHMSDKDFIGIFATPSMCNFSFLIDKSSLLQKMVPDTTLGGSKVTIPRNTEFTVNDIIFSVQYPIDIKLLTHGGIQISYDTSSMSPLQSLSSNVILYTIRTDSFSKDWIFFTIPTTQFYINSSTAPVSTGITFSQDITISKRFYYARVYYKNGSNNNWVEMQTTYTNQVYNADIPTAVITVIDTLVNVSIPQIYMNTNQISGTIRMDVYETVGAISMSMGNYTSDAFSNNLRVIDTVRDSNVYTAAMSNVAYLAYSTDTISDGSNSISFADLKTRVIDNIVGSKNLPITNAQIQGALSQNGYSIVKNVDTITNRIFLATKALPTSFDNTLVTAANACIETLIITMQEAASHNGVVNNGARLTLLPELVYLNNNGIISIVPDTTITAIKNEGLDAVVNYVNNNNLLLSPFHYVMDATADEFELRPYYLNKPVVNSLSFISQNQTTGLQVNTSSYTVAKTATGYTLTILTTSNSAYQDLNDSDVSAQLSFQSPNENVHTFLNGVLQTTKIDNERVFVFNIVTNFDINTDHQIYITNFTIFKDYVTSSVCNLTTDFNITYSAVLPNTRTWVRSSVDDAINATLLPTNTVGITQETVQIQLGRSLDTLWAQSRSVVNSGVYDRYTANVPMYYTEDVYQKDPITGAGFTVNPTTGALTYTKLHSLGDPVLNVNGTPTYLHVIGDIKLDSNGKPITTGSSVSRQIDLMLIESAYYFATDTSSITYKSDLTSTVVDWLTVDLVDLNQYLLEKTKVFFYPKKTVGLINITTSKGVQVYIDADQSFVLNLYITSKVYLDTNLRTALKKNTIDIINGYLKNATISISEIITALKTSYSGDVVSFNLSGLGGANNLETLTVVNDSDRCSIKKVLKKQTDNTLIVNEDVTINFIDVG